MATVRPSDLGGVLSVSRHGMVVNVQTRTSECTTQRGVVAQMLADLACPNQRMTVGADKAYDTRDFVKVCWEMNVTPYVERNTAHFGGRAVDSRTTRHPGYELSQRK